MVGAAIKGVSKILRKSSKKYPRKKSGMTARRNMLRGETTAEKYKKTMGDPGKQLKKQKKSFTRSVDNFESGHILGVGTGVLGTLAYQEIKKGKRAETKSNKDKLKKAADEHRKKDKKKKEKKHHSR